MKFFRKSSEMLPKVPLILLKNLDIRNMKYCGSHLTFYFFIKTKKMVFLEVTVTIIGENTSIKCLQCIKYDNS